MGHDQPMQGSGSENKIFQHMLHIFDVLLFFDLC